MPRYTTVAACALAQWALDFTGNLARVKESVVQSKAKGATFRTGPELELCGYGCEDHFFEDDTLNHCWESLAEILKGDYTNGILCDFGMPIMFENVRYNCRVFALDKKIVTIRPKMCLADDGNYRESRWFTAWNRGFTVTDFVLPKNVRDLTGQRTTKFGVCAISLNDTTLGAETCEELFTPENPGIFLGLGGAEILANGSGSHHTLGKIRRRLELITETTKKNGGLYLYSNQQGCDGSRLYFDGGVLIVMNGVVLAQGTQFSMADVEVVTATVDLNDIRTFRAAIASRGVQASRCEALPRVEVDWYMTEENDDDEKMLVMTRPLGVLKLHSMEEEIGFGPACWLWDYLRRSGMNGFFLPLSGGADSGATAAIVCIMCQMLMAAIQQQDATAKSTLADLRKVTRDPSFIPKTFQEISSRIFFACYMATDFSSSDTKSRAESLAQEIGASFDCLNIEPILKGFYETWSQIGPTPDIRELNSQQNIACQNIQARSRMVLSYMCAQLLPWRQSKKQWPGALLVLGSANLDEALRGYFTKYDCSCADLNPIGALSKVNLKKFLTWAGTHRGMPTLLKIATCNASAELQPTQPGGQQQQVSEEEMGLSFEELDQFGKLRILDRCGPLSMFRKLLQLWKGKHDSVEIAEKVKKFFRFYAINRHKMTTLTPSYHLENYSPDDNRFDQRQFLYDVSWSWQFRKIDEQLNTELSRKRSRSD